MVPSSGGYERSQGGKERTGRFRSVPLEAVSVGGLFCFDGETAVSQRRCKAAPLVNPSLQAPLRIALCLRSQLFCYFPAICTGGDRGGGLP
jgi:hypothetical protein